MTYFYGLLSYPHGGRVSAFLLLSMACGVVCTCYSLASCRFLTLDYQSRVGDFETHFYNRDPEEEYTVHRVSVGLFTWLRPFDTLDWTEGACAGYSQLQREVIVDHLFEMLRVVAILAIVIAVSCFLFTLSISCLAFTAVQRYMMLFTALLVGLLTGSAFMMTNSGLCTNVGQRPNCTIDQGGLVAIAGVAFWVLTALMAYFFVQPVHDKKLTPRMVDKRKRDQRNRQLEMLKELEALELEKGMNPASNIIKQRHRSERSSTRQHVSSAVSPPISPKRHSTYYSASSTPPRQSPQQQRSKAIPTILPLNRTSPSSSRKHKQMESPKGSPNRSHRRSTSNLHQQQNGSNQDEVEAIYQEKVRPVKKRRLRGDPSGLDNENSVKQPRHFVGEEKKTEDVVPQHVQKQKQQRNDDPSSMTDMWNSMMTPSGGRTTSRNDNNVELPLFMSRDVSAVVNERAVSQDVEVYIAGALDKIDSIIDDEENVVDKYHAKYEI